MILMGTGMPQIRIRRSPVRFVADPGRVVVRFFLPGRPERVTALVRRVLDLDDPAAVAAVEGVESAFAARHRDLAGALASNAARARQLLTDEELALRLDAASLARRLLVGACFTMEYAVSAAALFNPSLVQHPEQDGLRPGELRVVMSLRAVGEGHQSSLVFRSGVLDSGGRIAWHDPGQVAEPGALCPDGSYDRLLFGQKLIEAGIPGEEFGPVLADLREKFTRSDLEAALARTSNVPVRAATALRWLADSNYEVIFPEDTALEERVLVPLSQNDRNGIEDARFVRIDDDGDGRPGWHATYSAYSGTAVLPQLISTRDFRRFHLSTLNGSGAIGKGMALFPRRIAGRWWMLGRQDGETLSVMNSEHLHFWHGSTAILGPSEGWDLVQVGNCGSPIETAAGWLVLTHGVGPMRRYCIGAIMLDRDDPARVIARLPRTLLEPDGDERQGYVPNVLYSCGGLLHAGRLILPYAMSDSAAGVAVVVMDELIAAMRPL